MSDIKVSILCITYNQEKYIKQTIDSFLEQTVNFPIEILIHDDASTDNTANIIRMYEEKFPDLISAIYQTTNQYSQNPKVSEFLRVKAKGQYIALCEGDDYWTDPLKLQKQVDFLDNHPNCSLVVHAAGMMNATDNTIIRNVRPADKSRYFTVEEIISRKDLFATNSMVFRREDYKDLPDFYNDAPVDDYPLCIHLSLKGDVYYIDELMSVYRYMVPGSWTATVLNFENKKHKHIMKMSKLLDQVNNYTNHHYTDVIKRTKDISKFNMLIEQEKFNEAKKDDTRDYYKSLNFKTKVIINMKQYCPKLLNNLIAIRRKVSNGKSGR